MYSDKCVTVKFVWQWWTQGDIWASNIHSEFLFNGSHFESIFKFNQNSLFYIFTDKLVYKL